MVEHDRADGEPRTDGGVDHRRALGRRGVVRGQAESREPELEAARGQLEIRDPARREVGSDVHVGVEAAAHELARALRGNRMLRHCVEVPSCRSSSHKNVNRIVQNCLLLGGVPEPDVEILEARAALESLAAGYAALRRTDAEVKELRKITAEMENQFRTVLAPGRPPKSLAEHTAIVEAIAAGDRKPAEAAMRRHRGVHGAPHRAAARAAAARAARQRRLLTGVASGS